MPFVRVWLHYVWATKNRGPILCDNIRPALFDHIKQNASTKGIYLDRVNGYFDHVHCLISLGSGQTLDKIAQLIKGESSFWLNNKSGLNSPRLEWQDDYYVASVSESALARIRAYIDNQQAHHQKKTFEEEYNDFMSMYTLNEGK